jgi:hypothetical protein
VYRELGIQDKELKMNTMTILKAIGLKGQNNHRVPNEVLENLANLVYDPKGVFKSLAGAENPNGYVAALDATTSAQKPIIAILSPSRNINGYTFIPSVYDKQKFENFLERTHNEKNVLYIKEKGSELWGRTPCPPRHNSTPYTSSILTKPDIVKRVFERESQIEFQDARPLFRAKENNMEQEEKTPEERAFLNALHQRKVVADALKAGTLSCLPGADGYADTSPAVNVANGTRYHGANLLQLKEHQKANGFPTAEYVTKEALEKSGVPLQPGQRGVDLHFNAKNEAGQWESKSATLYNAAQSAEPEKLKAWGAEQISEKIQEKQEYLAQRYGISNQPKERENLPAPEVSPKSAEPEKYLGAYLAAVSMGGKFKPAPEVAAEFGKNFEAALFARGESGHTNPFALSKICNAAADHCKDTVREVRQEQRRELAPEREQTQSRGRGV